MKCKECEYHDNAEVCQDVCRRSVMHRKQPNYNPCYETRERIDMDDDTCVWNCEFCRKERKIKGGEDE
jgi:hypothetical protein